MDLARGATKVHRDYELSRGILAAGIVITVGYFVVEIWARLAGVYPTTAAASVGMSAIGSTGVALVLVGAVFTVLNRSALLRPPY